MDDTMSVIQLLFLFVGYKIFSTLSKGYKTFSLSEKYMRALDDSDWIKAKDALISAKRFTLAANPEVTSLMLKGEGDYSGVILELAAAHTCPSESAQEYRGSSDPFGIAVILPAETAIALQSGLDAYIQMYTNGVNNVPDVSENGKVIDIKGILSVKESDRYD